MLDIFVHYSPLIKGLYFILVMTIAYYVCSKIKQKGTIKSMLYVYLNYIHCGTNDHVVDYKEVASIFKFKNEEDLYDFIKKEEKNCRFKLINVRQIKMQ